MAGHRQRLRERFLNGGLGGFQDYEIVELLLTLGTPRRDCKQTAKQALEKLGSLDAIFNASQKELDEIERIGPANVLVLKLFQSIAEYLAKERIVEKITLDSPKKVADYLQKSIGREKKEFFVMLALDTHNRLIKVSHISVGTLDASLVHPREVFREAIECSASQIIIAHNHPAGLTDPSPEDLAITTRLLEAGKILDIEILDHIIVSRSSYKSLKEANLL